MKYNDYQLPGQQEFEQMAKAYTKRINENLNDFNIGLIDTIGYSFTYLIELYNFICKNLYNKKLRSKFKELEFQVKMDFNTFKDSFSSYNFNNYNLTKTKITSLSCAIKVAILSETELVENLLCLKNEDNLYKNSLLRIKKLVV